jgi:hypothetical protein
MTPSELLTDAFARVHDLVPSVVDGLTADQLLWRPDADANPIGWLVWHLTRVQDDHLAGVADRAQVYPDWADLFGLPYDVGDIGYGHTRAEVAAFRLTDPGLLTGYHEAVHAMTVEVVSRLSDADFDRVVDESFDPPVTAAVRLVSVLNDITQHVGQAAYVRGLAERR